MTTYYEAADGTKLAYLDVGEGPVVVLLHALMANHAVNWVDPGHVEALLAAGFRVVAPDMRGHGQSDASEGEASYSPLVHADDARRLIAALQLEPVSLVGYSYGSRTSALLAAEGTLRVQRLVLGGIAMMSLQPFPPGPEIDAFLAGMRADAATVAANPALAQARQQMAVWNARPEAVAATYAQLCTAAAVDVTRIDVPTLLLHSPVEADDVVDLIPGARSYVVAGDHLTAPLDPAFGPALVDFLVGS